MRRYNPILPRAWPQPLFPRLTSHGCALSRHELIRFDFRALLFTCRCGRRALSHRAYVARYSRPSPTVSSTPNFYVGVSSTNGAEAGAISAAAGVRVTGRGGTHRLRRHLRIV